MYKTLWFWEQNRLWETPRPVDQSQNLPKSDGKTNTGILREEQWQSYSVMLSDEKQTRGKQLEHLIYRANKKITSSKILC